MTTSRDEALLHNQRLPGESDGYRHARDELLRAELELKRHMEAVAAKRRELPPGGPIAEDYVFQDWDASVGRAREVRLSELFEPGKDTLAIYSFMFQPGPIGPLEVPCPLCTSIIDGIDGAAPHIAQRTSFAVSAKAPIDQFTAHARARGWQRARLLSSAGTTYNRDYHAEAPDGAQSAMLTTFVRSNGVIRHFWSSEEWHVPADPGRIRGTSTSCGRSGVCSIGLPSGAGQTGCRSSNTAERSRTSYRWARPGRDVLADARRTVKP